MNKELNIHFHFYLTLLLAFLLPIYPPFIPLAIALLFINWLAGGNFLNLFRKNNNWFYFLLFISLYMLYVIGLIYSENLNYGLKDLETKLSLLIFPMIYSSFDTFNRQRLHSIFIAFMYGCLTVSAICLGNAIYQYCHTHYLLANNIWAWDYGINFFLKGRLSIWIHPSYMSMYFVMALAAIYFFREKEQHSSFWKNYFIPFILTVFVLFLNSKAGIMSLLLLGIYVGWQLIFKERKIKLVATGITTSLILFITLYFAAPQFAIRLNSVFTVFSENVDVKKSEESTASRISVWNAAKTVIAENFPAGTGTGDVKDALKNEYRNQGMTFALQQNLNAHSQFLQTFAAIGIPGILSLCALLIIPLFREWKKRNYLYVIFLLLMTFNLLAESMFETQAGVIFYAFFNSLFLFSEE